MLNDHAKIALKYSGGKDSAACLELLRPIIDRVTVFWMNTGACYEGYRDYIMSVAATVPHFVEVTSDQPSYIRNVGIPSDIVPVNNTPLLAECMPEGQPRIVAWSSCCNTNIWQPLQRACLESGATAIVTGQRNDDMRKSPMRDGQVLDGIQYLFPLQDWSQEDVFEYLRQRNIKIPESYEGSETSPDCWDCSAFMDERVREIRTMKLLYPEKWAVVQPRLQAIKTASERIMAHIDARLED